MKKNRLAQNLSVNALQLILNQLFALVIFYLLSTSLDKNNFGQINLALAILMAAFNIMSLGMDQMVIKRIASGDNIQHTLSLYIGHVLLAGALFYGILLTGKFLFPQPATICNLLMLIGIGKLMIFFSTPFKQVASGLEKFKLLAYMSVVSNGVRCISLVVFALLHSIGLHIIIIIFIAGDTAELLLCIFLFRLSIKTPLLLNWDKANYIKLLRESLPQTGVVMITSALARFDWIFIGFTLSAIKLAEYSFAYKIFEVATLPLLTIAPLLIPRFTKLFKEGNTDAPDLKLLIRIEVIIAAFIALLLNVCWAPVIDGITAGKYGAVNVTTMFILSLCMPLLYVNNFLWSIYFAKGQLKMILHSFIVTFSVNVVFDIVLIPFYKNEGAAFAFLLSCLAQTIFYLQKNKQAELSKLWQTLIICTSAALASGLVTLFFIPNIWLAAVLSVLFYFVLLAITYQVKLSDRNSLRILLNW